MSPTLQTSLLRLRLMMPADAAAYAEYTRTEPDTWQYSAYPANTPERMRTYVERALADAKAGTAIPFTVETPAGNIIGSTRLYDYRPEWGTVKIGYTWYAEAHRGTGLNTHAKYLLLTYAFEELGVARVGFEADANNARSVRAMEKIGAQVEGVLRSFRPTEVGPRRDMIVLSILREEWEAGVARRLRRLAEG